MSTSSWHFVNLFIFRLLKQTNKFICFSSLKLSQYITTAASKRGRMRVRKNCSNDMERLKKIILITHIACLFFVFATKLRCFSLRETFKALQIVQKLHHHLFLLHIIKFMSHVVNYIECSVWEQKHCMWAFNLVEERINNRKKKKILIKLPCRKMW